MMIILSIFHLQRIEYFSGQRGMSSSFFPLRFHKVYGGKNHAKWWSVKWKRSSSQSKLTTHHLGEMSAELLKPQAVSNVGELITRDDDTCLSEKPLMTNQPELSGSTYACRFPVGVLKPLSVCSYNAFCHTSPHQQSHWPLWHLFWLLWRITIVHLPCPPQPPLEWFSGRSHTPYLKSDLSKLSKRSL